MSKSSSSSTIEFVREDGTAIEATTVNRSKFSITAGGSMFASQVTLRNLSYETTADGRKFIFSSPGQKCDGSACTRPAIISFCSRDESGKIKYMATTCWWHRPLKDEGSKIAPCKSCRELATDYVDNGEGSVYGYFCNPCQN